MEQYRAITLSFKCPKQLNELHRLNGDYYCDGCQKVVHDFRGMTEEQVLTAITSSNRKVCGIFEAGRITVLPQQNKWLKWASAAVLALGMTTIHQRIFAQTAKGGDTTRPYTNTPVVMGKTVAMKPGQKFSKEAIIRSARDTTTLGVFGFVEVSIEPSFPGGEPAIKRYLDQHIKNPKGLIGKSIATFVIERDGTLTDIKIIRSAETSYDNEIIKALQQMPKWMPAIRAGKKISVAYTMPINLADLGK